MAIRGIRAAAGSKRGLVDRPARPGGEQCQACARTPPVVLPRSTSTGRKSRRGRTVRMTVAVVAQQVPAAPVVEPDHARLRSELHLQGGLEPADRHRAAGAVAGAPDPMSSSSSGPSTICRIASLATAGSRSPTCSMPALRISFSRRPRSSPGLPAQEGARPPSISIGVRVRGFLRRTGFPHRVRGDAAWRLGLAPRDGPHLPVAAPAAVLV